MTRAEHICRLNDGKRTTREIALAVYGDGCNVASATAYVRVVLRQRKEGRGETLADFCWRHSAHGRPVHLAKCKRSKASQVARQREAS